MNALTMAATGTAVFATAITVPVFVDSFSWTGTPYGPGESGPSGWIIAMSYLAFIMGVSSLIMALVARRREQQRGSRAGQKLARWAIWVDIFGASLWGWTIVVAERTGWLGL